MSEIAVVEDERNLRSLFVDLLSARGHSVSGFATIADAAAGLRARHPDLLILDLQLPDGDGLELLRLLRAAGMRAPVVVVTAFGTVERAVSALRASATDFLVKPFDNDRLVKAVDAALDAGSQWVEVELSRVGLGAPISGIESLVGAGGGLKEVVELLPRIAATDATVLIRGESGTGKELIARAIHGASARRDGPLVALNCAALPATLLESELFGFERGSFTGAHARKLGLVESAAGGTLFLDEIGDMSLEAQVKLLRVLQEREVTRVGASQSVKVDVRIVAATHRDLEQSARDGRFRSDLLYRLSVVPLTLPPLRERRDDIPGLTSHFVNKVARRHGLKAPPLSDAVLAAASAHDWPGNVRELENWVERSIVLGRFDVPGPAEKGITQRPVEHGTGPVRPLRQAVAEAERQAVVSALEAAGGNKAEAARLLGVSYKTLFNKLHEHGLTDVTE